MPRLLLLIALCLPLLASCSVVQRDRCYLAETRYLAMRSIFEQTGSYQRVAQAMQDEQWAHCEVNQFRYRLRKDLGISGPEFDSLYLELEPLPDSLDFQPGTVRGAIR